MNKKKRRAVFSAAFVSSAYSLNLPTIKSCNHFHSASRVATRLVISGSKSTGVAITFIPRAALQHNECLSATIRSLTLQSLSFREPRCNLNGATFAELDAAVAITFIPRAALQLFFFRRFPQAALVAITFIPRSALQPHHPDSPVTQAA